MHSKTDMMKTLSPLAAAMKAKKEVGEPYVLCLGEGATLSSGCRAMRWAVRETIANECPWVLDDVLADLGRPERCGEDRAKFVELLGTLSEDEWYEDLLDEFFNLLDHRRGPERMQILNSFLIEAYPSPGYYFLALLAREGFFNVILNANYDPLLERALDRYLPSTGEQGQPMQPYQRLVNRADPSVKGEIEEALGRRTPRIKALWLHGHLWEASGIAFTPREKGDWYANVKDVVEKFFGMDLLLIGYTDRDADIRLALENAQGEGSVWYVATERPRGDIANALRARKHHHIIRGQAADFDAFCQAIFDLTLDLDDPQKVQKDDSHRLDLLREKREILVEYVETLKRRQNEDPMAPPTLQEQKEALQQELESIEEKLQNLE